MPKPKSTKLSDVAMILAGAAVSEGPEDAAVVVASDVRRLTVGAIETLRRAHVASGRRREGATLRDGDILVVAKGGSPRAAVVTTATSGAVASQNLLVVRPHPNMRSAALIAFLQTREGQRRLAAAQTGSAMPSLSVAALGRIEVPLLDSDTQWRLGAFVRAADEVLLAEEQALELRRELVARVTERVFAGDDLGDLSGAELT